MALAKLFYHMTKIDTGFKNETVGTGFGQVLSKACEVSVGAEQHFFACLVNGFPQFGITRDDDLSVDVGVHKRPLCPDKIIVLDDNFNACFGPGFHVK